MASRLLEGVRALDLGDEEGAVVDGTRGGAHRLHVGGARDEGLAECIDPVGGGEAQPGVVLVGEGADAEVDSGQIQPLAGAQLAADPHRADHVLPAHLPDLEQDEPVVDEQGVVGPHGPGQAAEAHAHPLAGPDDVIAGEDDGVVALELDGLLGEVADAHLGPWQVAHDGDPFPGLGRDRADGLDQAPMICLGAVGEVEARHVEPRVDHRAEGIGVVGGRANGRDDPGLVIA